jgi:hypothetical protein
MTLVRWIAAALAHRSLPIWLTLVAVLPLLPALRGGFQLDDHFQRFRLLGLGEPAIQLFVFNDGDVAKNARAIDAGWLPWWAAPDFRHASLRYLSVLTMQLDYRLWPHRPELMHLHSLAWLGALVAAAALFYRQVLGATWVAGLAALLYAVDDAHALPAAYLANRNAIVATCFGVLSLLCYARAREADARWSARLGPPFLALALAAGEMALAAAGYLLAYALFLERGTTRARLRGLAPNAVVLASWGLVYRLGGFGSTHSGFYREPLADPLAFGRAALERIPLLVMGQWTPLPSDYGSALVPGSEAAIALRWAGTVTTALAVVLFAPLVRRDRVARFFACGAALSLLPVAAVGPQDRLLFFVGLGSMGLLARWVHASFSRAASRFARSAAVALLAIHLVLAPPAALRWIAFQERASAKMITAVASVPADPALAEQDLILVNPPDYVYGVTAIPAMKRVAGEPSPRRLRALVAAPSALAVRRVDARTLHVQLEPGLFGGPFTRYHRAEEVRFAVGERIELTGFSVEILSLNEAGDPNELAYRFAVPLEDASLRWLAWRDGVYVPWRPPAAGETVRLPAPQGIFG